MTLFGNEPEPSGPDLLFEALCSVCGVNWLELTPTSRGVMNRAAKELRGVDATPYEIRARAQKYRQDHPTWSLTPMALVKHWPELGRKPENNHGARFYPGTGWIA